MKSWILSGILVSFLFQILAHGAEVDSFTRRQEMSTTSWNFANDFINNITNEALKLHLQKTSSCSQKTLETAILESLGDQKIRKLGGSLEIDTYTGHIEKILDTLPNHFRISSKLDRKESIYQNVKITDNPVLFAAGTAAIVKMKGPFGESIYIGGDKFSHFISQGHQMMKYYMRSMRQLYKNNNNNSNSNSDDENDIHNQSLIKSSLFRKVFPGIFDSKTSVKKWYKSWSRKVNNDPDCGSKNVSDPLHCALKSNRMSEEGFFGLGNDGLPTPGSGVFSYADLAANFDGFRFWLNTLGATKNSSFACDKFGKWKMVDSFDWTRWISPAWDEAVNPSRYGGNGAISSAVESSLKRLFHEKKIPRSSLPLDPVQCYSLASRHHYANIYFAKPYIPALVISPKCLATIEKSYLNS